MLEKKKVCVILLVLLSLFCVSYAADLEAVGTNPVIPFSATKGVTTFYQIYFRLKSEIKTGAVLQIKFPQEFSRLLTANDGAVSPECALKYKGQTAYKLYPCRVSDLWTVEITVGILSATDYELNINYIVNPSNQESSGRFGIYTLQDSGVVESNQNFGAVKFTNPPSLISNPRVIASSSLMSDGNQFTFTFDVPREVPTGSNVRFWFPEAFTANGPNCDVRGIVGNTPISYTTYTKKVVVCELVNKKLGTGETFTLTGLVNPGYSGTMQGFVIEIAEPYSTSVIYRAEFGGNVVIKPGALTIDFSEKNKFKQANTTHTYRMNLENALDENTVVYINYTNHWYMWRPNCTVVQGVVAKPSEAIRCRLIEGKNSYVIENYAKMSPSERVSFVIDLNSPDNELDYIATVTSYNAKYNSAIDLATVKMTVNSTLGRTDFFRATPSISKVKLPAGGTGPIELFYVMKKEYLNTAGTTGSEIRVEIFPRLSLVKRENGALACYFFSNIPAQKCIWDDYSTTTTDRTVIRIFTPDLRSFQYNEIPITITSIGSQFEKDEGVTIDTLRKRYRFMVHFLTKVQSDSVANNVNVLKTTTDELEVDFFDWFADKYTIPDNVPNPVITSLIKQANEPTQLKIVYTVDHDLDPLKDAVINASPDPIARELLRNYIIRITFQAGWDSELGHCTFAGSTIDYPCIVTGVENEGEITCRLRLSPESGKPTLDVIGWKKLPKNHVITIHVADLLIGSTSGIQAVVDFEVLEETPAMNQYYVELYYKRLNLFLIATANSLTYSSAKTVTSTIDPIYVDLDASYKFQFTTDSDSVGAVFELDTVWPYKKYKDGVKTGIVSCGSSINCYKFEIPDPDHRYWITCLFAETTSVVCQLPSGQIKNSPYTPKTDNSNTDYLFPLRVRSVDANGLILDKINFNIKIMKNTFTNPSFTKIDSADSLFDPRLEPASSTIYRDIDHYFLVQFTTKASLPKSADVVFTLSGATLQQRGYWFCKAEILKPDNTADSWIPNCIRETDNLLRLNEWRPTAIGATVKVKFFVHNDRSNTELSLVINTWYDSPRNKWVEESAPLPLCLLEPLKDDTFLTFDYMSRPVIPIISENAPLELTFTPTMASAPKLRVSFPSGYYLPPPTLPRCYVNNIRRPCYLVQANPLQIDVTFTFVASTSYKVKIGANFAPDTPGVYLPSVPGDTVITAALLDASNVKKDRVSFFYFVRPGKLAYMEVWWAHRTPDHNNMFTWRFGLPGAISANDDATNPTYIYLEFPTKNGITEWGGFDDDLGAVDANGKPAETGEEIPCSFDLLFWTAEGRAADTHSANLKCRLRKSRFDNVPAIVEITGFPAYTGGTAAAPKQLELRMIRLKNPPKTSKFGDFNIYIFKKTPAGVVTPLFFDTFHLWYQIDSNIPLPNDDNLVSYLNDALEFKNIGLNEVNAVMEPCETDLTLPEIRRKQRKLTLNVWSHYNTLKEGDWYVTEFPKEFNIARHKLSTCPTDVAECWCFKAASMCAFKNGKDLFQQEKRNADCEAFDIWPAVKFSGSMSWFSYVWQSYQYTHKVRHDYTSSKLWLLTGNLVPTVQTYGEYSGTAPAVNTPSDTGSDNFELNFRNRKNYISISFTARNYIPVGGAIKVILPGGYEPDPDCRSFLTVPTPSSGVRSPSLIASNLHPSSGEIQCRVINSREWIIKGLGKRGTDPTDKVDWVLNKGESVILYGMVKYADTSLVSDEIQAYTFYDENFEYLIDKHRLDSDYDTNPTSITKPSPNPSLIQPFAETDFLNFQKSEVIYDIPEHLREDHIGPFEFYWLHGESSATSETFTIDVYLAKLNIQTNQLSGFSYDSSAYYGCKMFDISANTYRACRILADNADTNFLKFTLTLHDGVTANARYKFSLTTYEKPGTIEGIRFPVCHGLYQIKFQSKKTVSAGTTTVLGYYNDVIEVFPQPFQKAEFFSVVSAKNVDNYAEIQVQPTDDLANNEILVINLNFNNVPGTRTVGLDDISGKPSKLTDIYENIEIMRTRNDYCADDPIDHHLRYMTCHYYKYEADRRLTIACSNFKSVPTINYKVPKDTVTRILLKFKNPNIAAPITFPVEIYTVDKNGYKINYNYFERGITIHYDAAQTIAFTGTPTLASAVVSASTTLTIPSKLDVALNKEDIYLVQFTCPVVAGYDSSDTNFDVYYLAKMKVAFLKIKSTAGVAANANLALARWINPTYVLPVNEYDITAYYSLYYSYEYKVITSATFLLPKLTHLTASTTPKLYRTTNDKDDYTDLRLEFTANFRFVRDIIVKINGIKFDDLTNGCVIGYGSEISLKECLIKETDPVIIQAKPFVRASLDTIYDEMEDDLGDKKLVIDFSHMRSKNNGAAGNVEVYLYTKEVTLLSNPAPTYMTARDTADKQIHSRHVIAEAPPTLADANPTATPFKWIEIPDDPYIEGVFQDGGPGQYSQLKLQFKCPADFTSGNVKITWPTASYIVAPTNDQLTTDGDYKSKYEVYCFLNEKRKNCQLDGSNAVIIDLASPITTLTVNTVYSVAIGFGPFGDKNGFMLSTAADQFVEYLVEFLNDAKTSLTKWTRGLPLMFYSTNYFSFKLATGANPGTWTAAHSTLNLFKFVFSHPVSKLGTIDTLVLEFMVKDEYGDQGFEPNLGMYKTGDQVLCHPHTNIIADTDANSKVLQSPRCFFIKGSSEGARGASAYVVFEGFNLCEDEESILYVLAKNPAAQYRRASFRAYIYRNKVLKGYQEYKSAFLADEKTNTNVVENYPATNIVTDNRAANKDIFDLSPRNFDNFRIDVAQSAGAPILIEIDTDNPCVKDDIHNHFVNIPVARYKDSAHVIEKFALFFTPTAINADDGTPTTKFSIDGWKCPRQPLVTFETGDTTAVEHFSWKFTYGKVPASGDYDKVLKTRKVEYKYTTTEQNDFETALGTATTADTSFASITPLAAISGLEDNYLKLNVGKYLTTNNPGFLTSEVSSAVDNIFRIQVATNDFPFSRVDYCTVISGLKYKENGLIKGSASCSASVESTNFNFDITNFNMISASEEVSIWVKGLTRTLPDAATAKNYKIYYAATRKRLYNKDYYMYRSAVSISTPAKEAGATGTDQGTISISSMSYSHLEFTYKPTSDIQLEKNFMIEFNFRNLMPTAIPDDCSSQIIFLSDLSPLDPQKWNMALTAVSDSTYNLVETSFKLPYGASCIEAEDVADQISIRGVWDSLDPFQYYDAIQTRKDERGTCLKTWSNAHIFTFTLRAIRDHYFVPSDSRIVLQMFPFNLKIVSGTSTPHQTDTMVRLLDSLSFSSCKRFSSITYTKNSLNEIYFQVKVVKRALNPTNRLVVNFVTGFNPGKNFISDQSFKGDGKRYYPCSCSINEGTTKYFDVCQMNDVNEPSIVIIHMDANIHDTIECSMLVHNKESAGEEMKISLHVVNPAAIIYVDECKVVNSLWRDDIIFGRTHDTATPASLELAIVSPTIAQYPGGDRTGNSQLVALKIQELNKWNFGDYLIVRLFNVGTFADKDQNTYNAFCSSGLNDFIDPQDCRVYRHAGLDKNNYMWFVFRVLGPQTNAASPLIFNIPNVKNLPAKKLNCEHIKYSVIVADGITETTKAASVDIPFDDAGRDLLFSLDFGKPATSEISLKRYFLRKAKDVGTSSILELVFKIAADLPEKGTIVIKTVKADYTTDKALHACHAFIKEASPVLLHCLIDVESTNLVIKLSAAFEKAIPREKEITVRLPIQTTTGDFTVFNLKGYSRFVSDTDSDIVYQFTTGEYIEDGVTCPTFADINNSGNLQRTLLKFVDPETIYTPFLYRTDLRSSTQDSYTPLRINFQVNTALPKTSKIKLSNFAEFNGNIDTSATYAYRCYFYEFTALAPSFYDLYKVMKESKAHVPNQECSFADGVLAVTVPEGQYDNSGNWVNYAIATDKIYQLVVTREPTANPKTNLFVPYKNYIPLCERGGFSDFANTETRKLTISTFVEAATDPTNRMTLPLYTHMGYTGLTFESLYVTSLLKKEKTSMLLTLKLVGTSALKSPSSYIEIEFPKDHFGVDPFRAASSSTTGAQEWNKCYLGDEDKGEANIHIPTGSNLNDERKRASCIYIPGKSNLPGRSAVLRIEGMNAQAAGRTIAVSIEDIYLPDEEGLFLSMRARLFNFGSTTTERHSLNIPFLPRTRKSGAQAEPINSLSFNVLPGNSEYYYQNSVWSFTTDILETNAQNHFFRFDFNPEILSQKSNFDTAELCPNKDNKDFSIRLNDNIVDIIWKNTDAKRIYARSPVSDCNSQLTLNNIKNQRADFTGTGDFLFRIYSENLMIFSGTLSKPSLSTYTKSYTLQTLNDPLIPSPVSQRLAHYVLQINLEDDKGGYDTLVVSTTNLEYQRCWIISTSFASNYLCAIGTNKLIVNGFSYGSTPGLLEIHVLARPFGPSTSFKLTYLASNDVGYVARESSSATPATITNFADCSTLDPELDLSTFNFLELSYKGNYLLQTRQITTAGGKAPLYMGIKTTEDISIHANSKLKLEFDVKDLYYPLTPRPANTDTFKLLCLRMKRHTDYQLGEIYSIPCEFNIASTNLRTISVFIKLHDLCADDYLFKFSTYAPSFAQQAFAYPERTAHLNSILSSVQGAATDLIKEMSIVRFRPPRIPFKKFQVRYMALNSDAQNIFEVQLQTQFDLEPPTGGASADEYVLNIDIDNRYYTSDKVTGNTITQEDVDTDASSRRASLGAILDIFGVSSSVSGIGDARLIPLHVMQRAPDGKETVLTGVKAHLQYGDTVKWPRFAIVSSDCLQSDNVYTITIPVLRNPIKVNSAFNIRGSITHFRECSLVPGDYGTIPTPGSGEKATKGTDPNFIRVYKYEMFSHEFVRNDAIATASDAEIAWSTTNYVQETGQTVELKFDYPSNLDNTKISDRIGFRFDAEAIKYDSFVSTTLSSPYKHIYYPQLKFFLAKPTSGITAGTGKESISLVRVDIQDYQVPTRLQYFFYSDQVLKKKSLDSATSVAPKRPDKDWTVKTFETTLSGEMTKNSVGVFKISFTFNYYLTNPGYMEIVLPANLKFQEYQNSRYAYGLPCSSWVGIYNDFANNKAIECYLKSSTILVLRGYDRVDCDTPMSLSFYAMIDQSNVNININKIDIFGALVDTAWISTPTLFVSGVTSVNGDYFGSFGYNELYPKIYRRDDRGPIHFVSKLRTKKFDGVDADTFKLILPETWEMATGSGLAKKNDLTTILPTKKWKSYGALDTSKNHFVRNELLDSEISTDCTNNRITYTIPYQTGYPVANNAEFMLALETSYNAANHMIRPWPNKYNDMYVQLLKGNDIKEVLYVSTIIFPKNAPTATVISTVLKQKYETMLDFSVTTNEAAVANDELWFLFETNDEMIRIFLDDLGFDFPQGASAIEINCNELSSNLISTDPIKCILWKGDGSVTHRKPAILKIKITKALPSGSTIRLIVPKIRNPDIAEDNYYIPITVRIMTTVDCRAEDGLICPLFSREMYYQTKTWSSPQPILYENLGNVLMQTAVTTVVKSTGLKLDVKFNNAIPINYYLLVVWPMPLSDLNSDENFETNVDPLPSTCVAKSGATTHGCRTWPSINWMLVTLASPVAANTISTILFENIPNQWYVLPAVKAEKYKFKVQAWNGDYAGSVLVKQTPATINEDVVCNTLVVPTQTTGYKEPKYNYWLPYDLKYWHKDENVNNYKDAYYWNVAHSEWTGFHTFEPRTNYYEFFIDQAGSTSFTLDDRHCNATLIHANQDPDECTEGRNDPYPKLFSCTIDKDRRSGSDTAKIIFKADKAAWPSVEARGQFKISLDFKFRTTQMGIITMQLRGSFDHLGTFISQTTGTIQMTDKRIFPRDFARYINTLAYQERMAQINEKVEWYILGDPRTPPSVEITKFVIQLDSEFGYPANQPDMNCNMLGDDRYKVSSCKFERTDGRTLLNIVPDKLAASPFGNWNQNNYYRLNITMAPLQFTAPKVSSEVYTLQVYYYAQSQLVEAFEHRLQMIQDTKLSKQYLWTNPQLDASTPNLFELRFRNGPRIIPRGYNTTLVSQFSSIALKFPVKDYLVKDSLTGSQVWTNNLGATVKQFDNVGCAHGTGVTVQLLKRLNCSIRLGTGVEPDNHPELEIWDYDEIAANTDVYFVIWGIAFTGIDKDAPIQVGVKVHNKNKYQSGHLYTYEAHLPARPTAYAGVAETTGAVVVSGSDRVLDTATYTFTATLTSGLSGECNPDYDWIVFDFGNQNLLDADNNNDKNQDLFDTQWLDFSGLKSGSANDNADAIPFALPSVNRIALQIKTDFTSGSQTFVINNLINPPYTMFPARSFIIRAQTIVGKKIKDNFKFTLSREIKVCQNFADFKATVSSSVGRQTQETLEVTFKTGHIVPSLKGGFQISLPEGNLMGDVYANKGVCTLVGFDAQATCELTSSNVLLVRLRGSSFDKDKSYTVRLKGVNIPNIPESQVLFTIFSVYDMDEADKKICTNVKPLSTPILITSLLDCSINVESLYTTSGQETEFYFKFYCLGPVRPLSEIRVKLPKEFMTDLATTPSVTCTSNEDILRDNNCLINTVFDASRPTLVIKAKEYDGYKAFTVIVTGMKNPAGLKGVLSGISFEVYASSMLYAQQSQVASISISSNEFTVAANPFVYVSNAPINKGVPSIFLFSLTAFDIQNIQIESVSIYFPENFAIGLGSDITCAYFKSDKRPDFSENQILLYHNLKQRLNADDTPKLPCTVNKRRVTITGVSTLFSNGGFINWAISNVVNPSTSENIFRIVYESGQTVAYNFKGSLAFTLGEPPTSLSLSKIAVTDNNVLRPSTYTWAFDTASTFLSTYYLGLAVEFPVHYNSVMSSMPQFYCTNSLSSEADSKASCAFYGRTLIVSTDKYKAATSFEIFVSSLMNPDKTTSCLSRTGSTETLFRFNFFLIDLKTNNLIASLFDANNNKNCIQFEKNIYSINIKGTANLVAGFTVTLTVSLEQRADGLTLTPTFTSPVEHIKFDPEVLTFNNYVETTKELKIIVSQLQAAGSYTIKWVKQETSVYKYFNEVLDTKLVVAQPAVTAKLILPTVDVERVSTVSSDKIPITVDVTLSDLTSDILYFDIEATQGKGLFTIEPTRLKFTPKDKTLQFSVSTEQPSSTLKLGFSIKDTSDQALKTYKLNITSLVIKSQAKPVTYQLAILSINDLKKGKTTYSFKISVSDRATVYYAIGYQGTRAPTAEQVRSGLHPKIISNGQILTDKRPSSVGDYLVTLSLSDISSQTNFVLFCVAQSMYGATDTVKEYNFRTNDLSWGALMKIKLTGPTNAASLVDALRSVLKISASRVIIIKDYSEVGKDTFVSSMMNTRVVMYDVLITPNATNDEEKPITLARTLISDKTKKKILGELLSTYSVSNTPVITEYRFSRPLVATDPVIKILFYYNCTIGITTWDKTKIYAIRIRRVNREAPTYNRLPTSDQIYRKMDQENNLLTDTPFMAFSGTTDSLGQGYITFQDLRDDSVYDIYITIGTNTPYDPPNLLADNSVRMITVTTPKNENLERYESNTGN